MNGSKWALVTGASRGLGLEIACALASAGYGLVITGRDADRLTAARQRILAMSKTSVRCQCVDLVAEAGPSRLYEGLLQEGVSLSLVVNNLGGTVTGDRRNVPTDILRASMRLNLEVGVEINNLFFEDLRSNQGVIVHVGSTAALHYDAPPGYVVSKSAVCAYVKNAARTFARDGVCIFAVLPGILEHEGSYIDSLRSSRPLAYDEALREATFGRFTRSAEVASLIVGLIQNGVPMVNGSLIQFDGGKE